jgi:hypothetical protein
LSANGDPRHAPSYCNVVLGEGGLRWPEVGIRNDVVAALKALNLPNGEPDVG